MGRDALAAPFLLVSKQTEIAIRSEAASLDSSRVLDGRLCLRNPIQTISQLAQEIGSTSHED